MEVKLEERDVGLKKTENKIINQRYIDQKVLDTKYISKYLDDEFDNKINNKFNYSKIVEILKNIKYIINDISNINYYKLGFNIGILNEILPRYFETNLKKIDQAIEQNNFVMIAEIIGNISDILYLN